MTEPRPVDLVRALKRAYAIGQVAAFFGMGLVGFVLSYVVCRVFDISGLIAPALTGVFTGGLGVVRVRAAVQGKIAQLEALRDRVAAEAAVDVGGAGASEPVVVVEPARQIEKPRASDEVIDMVGEPSEPKR